MKKIMLSMLLLLSSCNFTVAMNHSEGSATDVFDETDAITPTTTLTVPAKII